MSIYSHRLFSSFVSPAEMGSICYFTYYPVLLKNDEVQLLPSDHAAYYPLRFNLRTRTVVEGELNFFNRVLFDQIQLGNLLPEAKFNLSLKATSKTRCLIVNLIDNCYGHSFLKLLNLMEIYNLYTNSFDIWVICPKPLAHFVPEDKFYLATVKLGFEEAKKCQDLSIIYNRIKGKYSAVDYVTLDTYAQFPRSEKLLNFFGFLPERIGDKRYITFYYRSDYFRSWAGRHQQRRIVKFFELLKPYFKDCEPLVAGDLDNRKFPAWVKDVRTNAFGKEVDCMYNAYFKQSHFVIGLIGSNMLQPSMVCDFTVHLVPRPKITIVAEELFNHQVNTIPGWFKNIYLFGNDDLSDLTPVRLSEQTILLYLTYIAKRYKEAAFDDIYFGWSQRDFYDKMYGFFEFEKAQELKELVSKRAFKSNLYKYRITKLINRLRCSK